MMGEINNRILKKRLRKRLVKLNKQRKLNRIKDTQIRELRAKLKRTGQELGDLMENMTVEICPHCEREVMLVWGEPENLNAFCPYCGSRLMLCSCCEKNCDYDSETDVCCEM